MAGFLLARNLGYLGGAPSFNLPNVTGKPVAQATTTLKSDGLTVTQTNQVSTDAPGTVISTDPAPKSLVKKGDTVTLKVAEPAPIKKVAVPSGLVGVTQSQAESILQGQGLQSTPCPQASTTRPERDGDQHRPVVGHQGQPGEHGGPQRLVRSAQRDRCRTWPGSASHRRAVPSAVPAWSWGPTRPSSRRPSTRRGRDLDHPAAGTSVAPGSAVNLIISSGTPPTTTTTTTTPPSTTTTTTTPNSSTTTTVKSKSP